MIIPTHRISEHPGEILLKEFLEPLGITQKALAERIGITRAHVNEIIKGGRGITPRTAWLLAQAFRTTPAFWMNIQMMHDITKERVDFKVEPFPRPDLCAPKTTRKPLKRSSSKAKAAKTSRRK